MQNIIRKFEIKAGKKNSLALMDVFTKYGNTKIEMQLELSARPSKALARKNITTLEDLCSLSTTEVAEIRNIGKDSINEIVSALSTLGLNLNSSSPKVN